MLKNIFKYSFTSIVERSPQFKIFDSSDLSYFKSILPSDRVLTKDLDMYNIDWLKKYKGNAPVILKPKTNHEVINILKYCNAKNLAVVPQSGNTGLVGGSVPVHDEIIINLSKMDKIISHDLLSNCLHCEAGCILETLQNYLDPKGYIMPVDFGAKGSCMIGGMFATNAGGIHFIKYGSQRRNAKGLKAILADGTILDSLNPLPKNQSGYDLQQLFIGSEGTLGIITECLVHTPEKLKTKDLALLAFNKFEDILKLFQEVKMKLAHLVHAFEFFDNDVLEIQKQDGRILPLHEKAKFYVLVELASNGPSEENRKILEDFIANSELSEKMVDGVIAQNESQSQNIWKFRETIADAAAKLGIILSYDVSLPLQHFYKPVEATRNRIGSLAKVIGFGHIGDNNLHLNVCYSKYVQDEKYHQLEELMEPFIYDFVRDHHGSIGSEHGIGVHKRKYLSKTVPPGSIQIMKTIKKALDPKGIMNPYKVLI